MKTFIGLALFTLLTAPLGATDLLEGLPANRPAAQQEDWSQLDRQDWTEAVKAGEALVAAARTHAKDQPVQLSQALSMLGKAHLSNRDFAAAHAAFAEALAVAEQHAGKASQYTLDPLKGLGFTLAADDRHAEALPYLDRALLISHRTHGLFHPSQQSILRHLANSLTHTGQALEAERHVNYMLQVGERKYGKKNPEIVPLMCSVGDWHAEIGVFDNARRQYRDAIRLIEKKLGPKDVALVLPLRRLAWSYVHEVHFEANGFLDPYEATDPNRAYQYKAEAFRLGNPRYLSLEGQRALLRAISILKENPGSQALLLETLVDLGDWYQVKQESHKALPFYREAAQVYAALHAADEDGTTSIAAHSPFVLPLRLYYPVPGAVARGHQLDPDRSEEVYVQMQLTVTRDGSVKDAKLIDASAQSRQATEFVNAMKAARFRPKLIEGEPVDTVDMDFREVFRSRKKTQSEGEENPS
jgi:tetratricopeptide (TPR) repeat protein